MVNEPIILPTFICLRCGHQWYPKKPERPLRCAASRCKTPYWDRPRGAPKKKRKPSP